MNRPNHPARAPMPLSTGHATLPLLLLLAGCVDYASIDYVIDLRAGKATITYQDLRGEGQDDLATLIGKLIPEGNFEAEFPRATVLRKEAVARQGRLDVDVELKLATPSEAGVGRWDARHPYRLCPPEDAVFVETNASFRDADGCVIWEKGARVLRAQAVLHGTVDGESLLPLFEQWVAAGRPDLSVEPESAPPPEDPATP